eukprot:1161350-Pelagomonas_calceolata.AAC.2
MMTLINNPSSTSGNTFLTSAKLSSSASVITTPSASKFQGTDGASLRNTSTTPSPARPVTAASSSSNNNPRLHTRLIPVNEQQGEAATVRAHQFPTTQHRHYPPPAAGAAAPGQNTGGAVKKG